MQLNLDLGQELVIDLFAGGGGASLGIEQAIGRPVDIAVNHDREAVAVHAVNHPHTKHYCEDVFSVDPVAVTNNRPVGLLWGSPDCTHHSKAKGGKPLSRKRRSLAWALVKWARLTRPRVIALENVTEFEDWGPLDENCMPRSDLKGQHFKHWTKALRRMGYIVEWRALAACDYGAPTIRKRLFLIARRDGLPIVWPEPQPAADVSAASVIDWSVPMCSIFATQAEANQWAQRNGVRQAKRPLAHKTMQRIAKGTIKCVLNDANPHLKVVTPTDTRDRSGLVAALIAQHQGQSTGRPATAPASAITTNNHHALVAAYLVQHNGGFCHTQGRAMGEPVSTVTTTGSQQGLVYAFLAPYYSSGSGQTGRSLNDPSPTVTTRGRLQVVTVSLNGKTYALRDIATRMLTPRELYRIQGFPDTYIIDRTATGKAVTKTAQIRMCGNSVCPPIARAIIRANFAHEVRKEAA